MRNRKLIFKGYEKAEVIENDISKFWDWMFQQVLDNRKKMQLTEKQSGDYYPVNQTLTIGTP